MYPETITVPNPDHLHTFALKGGGQAHVLYDHDAESPRMWDCNVSRMATLSRDYVDPDGRNTDRDLVSVAQLARVHGLDEAGIRSLFEFDPRKVTDADVENAQERGDEDFLLLVDFGCNRQVAAVNLFDYGHRNEATGLAVIFQDEWDALLQGWQCPPEPDELLRIEVDTYVRYVEGQVYGVIIHDADGNEVESCWDFHGYEYDDRALVEHNFDVEVQA